MRLRRADVLAHAALLLGVVVVSFPIWMVFAASTHPLSDIRDLRLPLLPGDRLVENYAAALFSGTATIDGTPVWRLMANSLAMALGVTAGKIAVSLLAAFAIVYFRFPLRRTAFWLVFATLMLPVEVRIVPTFKVVADLGLLDSYAGLTLPLLASATGTFLFRQTFLTVPRELVEAAKMDGAGPLRFFWQVLLPLSRTNIAALSVILFIYGWNQYLWPLLATTRTERTTIIVGIRKMIATADAGTEWHLVMAAIILAMLPPLLVMVAMQRRFVRGLTETEK
jgi:sn-glycerol 3-phosphate transport system permease protein